MKLKICPKCDTEKTNDLFSSSKKTTDGYKSWCKDCEKIAKKDWVSKNLEHLRDYERKRRLANPEKYREKDRARRSRNYINHALTKAKGRAKKMNIEFSLTLGNIPPLPTHCPALGVKLETGVIGNCHNAPSLDRINSAAGYTPDNVAWISWRANRIKSDATIADLENIIQWLRKMAPSEILDLVPDHLRSIPAHADRT